MKLLTATIPCYNSAEYMSHAIETLLTGGEDMEIIIVNDGSTDNTAQIADEYAMKYPTIIRAIHQENGGHGEAVNAGIRHAKGLYYKVVDSDDWVNEKALAKILEVLRVMVEESNQLDMLVSNYVYENVNMEKKKVMHYRSVMPIDRLFTWDEIGHFKPSQNILMHSVIYRTKMLRDCGLQLPKHTFYVDNIFVYQPLVSVKTIYYLDVNFYRYFIGREDQSVNEQVMMSRIDQQIKITKIMINVIDMNQVKSKRLRTYMVKYLSMMMTVSSIFLIKLGTKEDLEKKKELWIYLHDNHKKLYFKVRSCILGMTMNLPGKFGRKVAIVGYNVSRKIYGFC